MPDIQPPELAALLDLAERPRTGGWSLRAALTRYAQGQPRRVGDLLQLVRRIEHVVGQESKTLAKTGPEVWSQLGEGSDDQLVGVLRAAQVIDTVGDTLAVWADDPWNVAKPDAAVDEAIAAVTERLAALGVPEEGPPDRPPSARRRG